MWSSFPISTFIIATGYSGNALATAFAPIMFVRFDKPTKNSRPKLKQKFRRFTRSNTNRILNFRVRKSLLDIKLISKITYSENIA